MSRSSPSSPLRRLRPALVAVAGALVVPTAVAAEPAQKAAPAAQPAPPTDPMQSIGSISVGHPHHGFLINGVRMPKGEHWILGAPGFAWGTDETIAALMHCARRLHEQFPDAPKLRIGAISKKGGGPFPPHKSHRTGRDADVHFVLTHRTPKKWYEAATAENLDRERTWALLRLVITETDVEMVLIDRSVQALLEEYALKIGEDPAWVADLFHGSPGSSSLIKHVPGHTGHMHIRFVSPIARRRGVAAYDRLVQQGHVVPPSKRVEHEVVQGDTLSEIAAQYGTSVEELQKTNGLDSTVIKLGQKLTITERVDIKGARDPVVVPKRRLPPQPSAVARASQ
jgi:LysM repeat protein